MNFKKINEFVFVSVFLCYFSSVFCSDIKSTETRIDSSSSSSSSSSSLQRQKANKPFEFSFPKRNSETLLTTDSSKTNENDEVKSLLSSPFYIDVSVRNVSPSSSSSFSSPFSSSSLNNFGDAGIVLESEESEKKSFGGHSKTPKLNHVEVRLEAQPSSFVADEAFVDDNSYLDFEVSVRKCCPKDEAFIKSLNSCASYEMDFTVTAYVTKRNAYLNITSDQMHIQEGLLTACAPSILDRDEFILFDSGEIFSSELDEYFHPDHYCLENIVDDFQDPHFVRLTAAYCPISKFPQAFDPSKVAVRKCCPQNELVSSETAECIFRSEVTSVEWTVPVEYLGLISSRSTNFTSVYEIAAGYPECVTKERGESLDSSWNFEVSEATGYLHIPSLNIFTPSYCIDDHNISGNRSSSFAYVCLSDSDHRKFTQVNPSCQPGHDFCVEKCCPVGQMLNQDGSCIPDDDYIMLPQSVPIYFPNGTIPQVQNIDFNFGSPLCGSRGIFVTKEEERGEIMSNGSLRFISYDPNECDPKVIEYIPQKDYCYDLVRFEGLESHLRGPVPGALICYPRDFDTEMRQAMQVNYIYSIFLTISDIFILISFVIYLTVPDQTKRGLNKNVKLGHSILGRILLSFLFSLFFAYLCLILTKTVSDPINLASNVACIALGVIMYISFLATFFWLNVLCFELWWKCARQESTSGRRWLWYQFYAWGNPLLLGSIVLYIEFSPAIGPCFVKPNFGIHSCFFSETRTFGSAAKWVYLNGPVAVLLLTDLLFFLLTVKSLLQTVKQSHKGTVKRQARQRLKLCFKLFLVMGICWLTEIISAATSTSKWYITEVFNCLQGFVIFLIFILKPKILHAVRERICSVCCGRHTPRQPLRGNGHDSSIVEVSLRSRSDRSIMPKNNGFK